MNKAEMDLRKYIDDLKADTGNTWSGFQAQKIEQFWADKAGIMPVELIYLLVRVGQI